MDVKIMKTITILKPIKTIVAKTTFFAVVVFLFISMFGESIMAQTISGSGLGIKSQALPFAVKTSDEVPNERGLGNVASETTIAGFAVTASDSGNTPLYGTFELILDAPGVSENKFTKFASVVFSKGTRNFNVDGFHDGGDIWRARFMPDQEGIWNYSWSFHNSSGNGSFVCTVRTNAKAHGHVKVDSAHSRYLVYDDGTAHHWFGGKWIAAPNYGPSSKGAETNDGRYSDAEFLNYLNTCENYKHNGLLIKTSLYPIENDKFSWDLTWIHRGEWMIKEMAERGIYCQVNFFDTWSRDKDKWFSYNTNGPSQVFNVWASGDEDAKENYIRTIVARFSGFYNVYWELGNEMEHSPNSGSAFVTEANAKYIPWTRQYDPYGLPIGLSENVWKNADVDIGFLHQPRTSSLPSTSWTKPTIMNELVSGDVDGSMWRDDVIRDSTTRYSYRSTFWRMFTYGGVGSSEATWLNIKTSLNDAVLNVMSDQKWCQEFINALPVHINEMNTDTEFVNSGPGSYRTRRKDGQCYVTYFLLGKNQNTGSGTVNVDLPAGIYTVKWYNPKDGNYTNQSAITSSGGTEIILHPAFTEDIVLLVETSASVTTPLSRSNPDNFTLQQNYPNPFNPSTTIKYSVAKSCNVQIKIYNQLGQEVYTLVNERKVAGEYNVRWDSKDAKDNKLANGIYYYRLTVGKQSFAKKMLYLR